MPKKIFIFFPKDSEALFNIESNRTFGGASVQLYNIAKGLKIYTDLDVYSLIPNYPKINFKDNKHFKFLRLFNEDDNSILKFFKTHITLHKNKPDIIIQRGLTTFSCLLSLYCKIFRIRFIFMYAHDNESHGRFQKNNKRCFLYNLILFSSSHLIVQNIFQLKNIPVIFLYKTTQLNSVYIIPKKANLSTRRKSILWVSRLEPWKGPEKFILLAKKFPGTIFLMIAPVFHREKEYGENIIKEIKKVKNIKYIDFVHYKTINRYFKKSFLFVNTSDYEGFPNTFIQATMNGTPVLSFNVNPNNMLTKNEIGFFCENDLNTAEAFIKTLIKSNKMQRRISNNSYEYALMHHDISVVIKKLEILLLKTT
ncbi:MAG TPA: glycosyltransferase family 4 protein [Spirochaetota bacterium]|nr:glycosyltransferase family 4 protein [Spirochaetota bacterium]